jgi:serine phosphatase RsbU (regulator of sigma subunit)
VVQFPTIAEAVAMISPTDLRILVVGESTENRQVARWMLNRAFSELTVFEATNEQAVQAVFEDERVDCILVDEEISGPDELLKSLSLKNRAHVPVVLVTADPSELKMQAAALGVEHWLAKDNLSAQTMELIVRKAIDVSSLRLMLEEQGRELERLRADTEERATLDARLEQAALQEQASQPAMPTNELDPGDDTVVDGPMIDLAQVMKTTSEPDPASADKPLKQKHGILEIERPRLIKDLPGATNDDYEEAAHLQKDLLPAGSPSIDGFDIAGLSIPASRTGGDYYDYLPIADDLLTITIGECSGQGMAPAMMMASLRAYLRVISQTTMDVEDTISQANRLITEDIQDEEFVVTMMVAQIDQLTRSVRYASAGHQAHLLDRHGEVHVLHSTGMPMGLQEDTIIPEGTSKKLKAGDVLLLSTDGAQKLVSPSGEQLGMERLLDVIRKNKNLPARMIVNFLQKECRAFADSEAQADDITFVIVKSEGVSYL